jgi:hypothetical protein
MNEYCVRTCGDYISFWTSADFRKVWNILENVAGSTTMVVPLQLGFLEDCMSGLEGHMLVGKAEDLETEDTWCSIPEELVEVIKQNFPLSFDFDMEGATETPYKK